MTKTEMFLKRHGLPSRVEDTIGMKFVFVSYDMKIEDEGVILDVLLSCNLQDVSLSVLFHNSNNPCEESYEIIETDQSVGGIGKLMLTHEHLPVPIEGIIILHPPCLVSSL